MNLNLYVDAETSKCLDSLPRKFSASKIFRYIIKANQLNEDDWQNYFQTDKDAKEIRMFLQEKIKDRI